MKFLGFLAALAACFLVGGGVIAQENAAPAPPMLMPMAPMDMPSIMVMVGISDLIVIGTVKKITPKTADVFGYNSRAVIEIEQTVKGKSFETVEFNYHTQIKGRAYYNPYSVQLKEGQRSLFILQRSQPGWALQEGMMGVKTADQLDKFAQIAAEFPVQVTIETPVLPMYFGHPVVMSVTVSNNGKDAFTAHPPQLQGFFYSARMGAYLPVQAKQEYFFGHGDVAPAILKEDIVINNMRAIAEDDMPGQPKPQVIEPGASYTFTLEAGCLLPESWKVFTPETFLQAPVALHARVFCQRKEVVEGQDNFFTAVSSWVTTMTGFHPPLEDGSIPKPNTTFDPSMAAPGGSEGGGANPGGGGPIVNPAFPVEAIPIPLDPTFDPGMGNPPVMTLPAIPFNRTVIVLPAEAILDEQPVEFPVIPGNIIKRPQ